MQAVPRRDALDRGNGNVCSTGGVTVAHFYINMAVGIREGAVAGCLLDQLAAMGENECLRRQSSGGDAINQMSEYDCLACPSG